MDFTCCSDATRTLETVDDLIVIVTDGPEASSSSQTRVRETRIVFDSVVYWQTLCQDFPCRSSSRQLVRMRIMSPVLET